MEHWAKTDQIVIINTIAGNNISLLEKFVRKRIKGSSVFSLPETYKKLFLKRYKITTLYYAESRVYLIFWVKYRFRN